MSQHWQTYGKYAVEMDGVESEIDAASLAEVTNKIRGKAKHYRVWSPAGLLLIDTKYGDVYELVTDKEKSCSS